MFFKSFYSLCVHRFLWRPEGTLGLLELGVTGGCELLHVGAKDEFGLSALAKPSFQPPKQEFEMFINIQRDVREVQGEMGGGETGTCSSHHTTEKRSLV